MRSEQWKAKKQERIAIDKGYRKHVNYIRMAQIEQKEVTMSNNNVLLPRNS